MKLLAATAACRATIALTEEPVICGRVAVIALMDGRVSSATRVSGPACTPAVFHVTHVSVSKLSRGVISYFSIPQLAPRDTLVKTAPSPVSVKTVQAVTPPLGAAAAPQESVETYARMVSWPQRKQKFSPYCPS